MSHKDLLIRCHHQIGSFKYIIVKRKQDNKLVPLRVYLNEVQANATSYDKDSIVVSVKYKIRYCGKTKWINEDNIYDTKEEAYKIILK